ncbi:beta-lactamase-like protein [Fusarium flagelliforme]|uniref:beta-lactamase-like protein n=1 Tax=Fusarium flagelliforme TaxID=2675880 RepID=UPI001E8E1C6B|nr:beta-lactamase-like protein [Fusarium flagelliforme]KAH7184894.1 beta-lactamase-like protein [Fusarium flagelliforme]
MLASSYLLALLGLVCPALVGTQVLTNHQELVNTTLAALGGVGPLSQLKGVTFQAERIYRSRSLMQSYQPMRADTSVMSSGSQNVSYKLDGEHLQQRIDRHATPSSNWQWGSTQLKPLDFSLVVRDGDDGFACYVKGNNMIHLDSNVTSGYTDFHNVQQGITVILDRQTKLPYIIRRTESHPIYGIAYKDLYLSFYKDVQGIKFPHAIQTVYSAQNQHISAVLEDFVIDQVDINPDFPADFFDGIPENESMGLKSAPAPSSVVPNGLVTDYSSSMLGSGVPTGAREIKEAHNPVQGLSQVHWLVLNNNDALGFKLVVIEFEKEVILCDAPPEWSETITKWVADNLRKPIKYIAPSHHHRDHSGGVPDFVKAGATLIIPEVAVDYWSSIPNAKFITFNQTHPYVHRDGNISAWFNWENQAAHAADWTYVVITQRCATPDSPVVAFEADSWEAGINIERSSIGQMRQWLDQIVLDGLPKHTVVFPSHGDIAPLRQLIDNTAYPYPEYDVSHWRKGAAICK